MDVKKFAAIAAALAMAGTVSLATASPDTLDNLLTVSAATYLKLESSGDSVKQLQQNLITLNYMQSGSDTGTFDATTDGAVKNLQTDYNLKVDGIVGPDTLGLVDGLVNGTATIIKVDAAKVNVRSSAGTNGTIVTTVGKDQKLKYSSVETVGDVKWYQVTVGDKQGYICGSYVSAVQLTPVNATTTTTAAAANTTSAANATSGSLRVTGTILNVRSSTSTSSKKLTTVQNGQIFTYSNVKSVDGVNWYYIKVDSTTSGWVMGSFVSLVNASQAGGTLKVTGHILNVRSSTSTSSDKITTVQNGQTYTYTDVKNVSGINWYYIQVNSSTSGWVMGSYVSLVQTGSGTSAAESGSLKVTGTILNVRASASTSAKKLTTLQNGQTYTYSDTKTVSGVKWYYIRVNSSISGWVMGTYVYPTPNPTATTTTTTAAESDATAVTTIVSAAGSGTVKVTGTVVNVRSGAGTGNSKITQVRQGESYTYTDSKDGWYYIQVSATQKGWIMGDYVEVTPNTAASTIVSTTTTTSATEAATTTTAAAAGAESGTLTVTGTVVNVRSGAGTENTKLTEVKQGENYTYTDVKNGWYYIQISAAQSGWICGDYVQASANTTTSATASTVSSESATTTTAPAAETGTLKVTGTVVNVRSGAGTDNTKITEVKQGENYTYTNQQNGWYYIQISATQSGWICGDYVEATPNTTTSVTTTTTSASQTTTTAAAAETGTLKITGTVVNVRSGIGTDSAKITEVKQGENYTYTDKKNGWYYIQLSATQSGWVTGDYVEAVPNTTTSVTTTATSASESANSSETTTTAPSAETGILTVIGTVVNVRSGPGADNTKITEVKQGSTYTYTDKQNDWYYIWISASQKGWISGQYVQATAIGTQSPTTTTSSVDTAGSTNSTDGNASTTSASSDASSAVTTSSTQTTTSTTTTTKKTTTKTTTRTAAKESGSLQIVSAVVNVRSGPSTSYGKIKEVRFGEAFNYIDVQNGWFCIQLSSTQTGWVSGQYVQYLSVVTTAIPYDDDDDDDDDDNPQSGNGTTAAKTTTTTAVTTTTALTTTTTAYKETGTLVVKADVLNVRADNLATAQKITEVKEGGVYKYTDYNCGWYYILVSATKGGWVLGNYVEATPDATTTSSTASTTASLTTTTTTTTASTTTTDTDASATTSSTETTATSSNESTTTTPDANTTLEPTTTTSAATVSRTVTVGTVSVSGTLNVRSGAGTNYSKLGTLKNGTTVIIVSKGSQWHKIEYGAGYGYVSADYIKDIKTTNENMILKYSTDYNYVNQGSTIALALSAGGAPITYSSSDSVRCPISSSGIVTGKTEGLYTITAKSGSAVTTTCVVVLKAPYTDVQEMKISAQGTQFIADWEGGGTVLPTGEIVFYPYQDVSGYWTIGYGHAKTTTSSKSWSEERAISEFNKDIEAMIGADYMLTDERPYLTAEGATALLNADLNDGAYVKAVSDWAVRNGVKLTQTQFDALVSFCYNLGPSLWQNDTTKFYLKSAIISHRSGSDANADQVIEGFCRYMKSSGKNYKGLWYRRRNEAELFLEGDYALDRENKFTLPSGITWA